MILIKKLFVLALINANVKPRPLEESQKIGDIYDKLTAFSSVSIVFGSKSPHFIGYTCDLFVSSSIYSSKFYVEN